MLNSAAACPIRLPRSAIEALLFSAISGAGCLPHLEQAHALLYRHGLSGSNYLAAKLIRRAAELHTVVPFRYPSLVFSQVPSPNPFLWTSLIHFSAIAGPPSPHPLLLYSVMRRASPLPPPLSFTFSALLKSSSASQSVPNGTQVHAQIVSVGGFDSDLFVQNTLIDFYVRCGLLCSARKVFDGMTNRDAISWTSLIVAYSRNGDMGLARDIFDRSPAKDMVAWTAMVTGYTQNAMPNEALEAFRMMQGAGIAVDEVSLSAAISACAQLGSSKNVSWAREIAERNGLERNVVVASAMVDMYGKCGHIVEARRVFNGIEARNVYTYSVMITSLAAHGRAAEAICLFEEMTAAEVEVKPNCVTFLGVLTACSHAGMVEQGQHYFRRMQEEYGIEPNADHYACMVDLLGRAGLVEEALEMATTMRSVPNGGVWGALLGACRIHKKPHIARIAADHLLNIESESDSVGNYVLLSNIFASAGMWEEVCKVRKMMKQRGLRKNPASSFVETDDGTVHEFFAGDDSHPRSREIKDFLDRVMERMKKVAGYLPVLSSVVYGVSDGEKERLLKGHNEKLALVFGLLATGPGKTIRIVKNLRICEDCHVFMCLASSMEGRQIVVRDIMRFHHFKDGVCSCGGFW